MRLFASLVIIVLMLMTVGLAVGLLSATKITEETSARLELTQAELQRVKSSYLIRPDMMDSGRLRQGFDGPVPGTNTGAPAVRPATSWAWLEQLRQQNPGRYQQIIVASEQRRKQADEWYNETMAQLSQRAQATTVPAETDLIDQITETISKLSDLRQQMQAVRDLPPEEAQAVLTQLIPALQSTTQHLSQLRDQDRAMQLQDLASQLGLKGDNVQTLVQSVPQIYKNTQYYNTRGPGGGRFIAGPMAQPVPTVPSK